MSDFDVIVIGAGPAGSSAAKAAAERGMRVLVLEEHNDIGHPKHCSGMMHGTPSGLSTRMLKGMDPRVTLAEVRTRRIYSPHGRIYDIPVEGKGVYIVDRALFDQHLAGEAASAGAQIMLGTKTTGLIIEEGRVAGVTTEKKGMQELRAKIIIGADGVKSHLGGVPVWSGLAERATEFMAGISMLVANVKDVSSDIMELHLGPFCTSKRYLGYIWVQRNDQHLCHMGFDTLEDFERCKRGNSILSKKLANAVVTTMTGYAQPLTNRPGPLAKKVRDGLILAGAACNYPSFLLNSLSGSYAGQVAAEAVRDGDVSESRLAVYDTMCHKLDNPGWWSKEYGFGAWMNMTEDQQEALFEEMTRADHVNFDVYENL